MNLGPPWTVKATPFNQALADGEILRARRLLAEGHGPDPSTWQLARLIDTPGVFLFLNELQPCPDLLAGSPLQSQGPALLAEAKAERLALAWGGQPGGAGGRARF